MSKGATPILSPIAMPAGGMPRQPANGRPPLRIGHYMRHMFEPGGIASYIHRVSGAQRAAGHHVSFFDRTDPEAIQLHAHPGGDAIIYTADDADLFRRAAEARLDVLHLHTTIDADALASLDSIHGGPRGALRLIRTVHTHSPYCPSQGRFLKQPGVPCNRNFSMTGCLFGHLFNRCGSARFAVLRRNFGNTRNERATLPRLTTIVVSQFLKDQMIRAGYPPEQIHVLHLPAPDLGGESGGTSPVAATHPPSSPPTFLFLGRMIPHKGVDWLLRAFAMLGGDARLELGGAGGHEAHYRALSASLELSERVRFLGWLSPDEVARRLSAARALVFPSLWHEPGGTVAFEAMAHARPVIVSGVGGMPEVVTDGVTGLVVPPGDDHALAGAMQTLARDEPLARRMGLAGRDRALAQHTLRSHLDRLMTLYASVMA